MPEWSGGFDKSRIQKGLPLPKVWRRPVKGMEKTRRYLYAYVVDDVWKIVGVGFDEVRYSIEKLMTVANDKVPQWTGGQVEFRFHYHTWSSGLTGKQPRRWYGEKAPIIPFDIAKDLIAQAQRKGWFDERPIAIELLD